MAPFLISAESPIPLGGPLEDLRSVWKAAGRCLRLVGSLPMRVERLSPLLSLFISLFFLLGPQKKGGQESASPTK